MGLHELRERLDAIDAQVIALLAERAQVVAQVAEHKRAHDLPVHMPEREAAIIARLRALNPGPLRDEAIERIYRTVIEEMRQFEHQRVPS